MQNQVYPILNKPIYNQFIHIHDFDKDLSFLWKNKFDEIFQPPIIEAGGYIAVFHEPTYIDMNNSIHFNPSPIFIPSPPSLFVLLLFFIFYKRKTRHIC